MANAEFVKVKGTAKLSVSIIVTLSDGSTKALTLKEGDHVSDLVYVEDGNRYTVTGDVKVINYSVKPAKTTTGVVTCVHDTESDFSTRVSATSLVIDCSGVYDSDIRVVPVSAIRDFESIESSELVVTNAKFLSDTEVSFICNVEPVAAIWNGKSTPLGSVGDGDSIYTITVNTMKKANTLVVVTASSRDSVTLTGKEPEVYQANLLTESLTTLLDAFVEKYVDKMENDVDVEVPDEEFYLEVASGVTDTTKVDINGKIYNADESISIDIGNGSYVNKCIFKIADGKLFLAAPALYTLADENGDIAVLVNGFDLFISVNVTPKVLSIDPEKLDAVNEKYDCKHTVVMTVGGEIVEYRQDGLAYVDATLVDEAGSVIPSGTVLYGLKSFDEGETADLYSVSKVTDSKVVWNNTSYNGLVDTESTTNITYTYRAVGVGYGVFPFVVNESIPERKGKYTVSSSMGSVSNFSTLADAITALEPNDTIVLGEGVYTEPLLLTKPLSIIGSGLSSCIQAPLTINISDEEAGKVELADVIFSDITSEEGTGGTKATAKGACISVKGNVDLRMDGVEIKEANHFYSVMELNTTGSVAIQNCNIETCDSYHFLETVYDKTANPAPNGLLIEGCKFGKFNHNVINFYSVEEGATITIRDCKFERSANAVRLSNITDAHATFNFVNLEYAETDNPPEDGLLIMQDALGDEDFGKFTLNFKSVAYAPENGKRVVFTAKDMAEAGQLWYIYKNDGEYTKELPKTTYSIIQ